MNFGNRQVDLERLRREHRALDEQIIALEGRRWLSVAEEDEIKRLKRRKLQMKDQIATLADRERAARP
ncbi:MAG TPA: hypothetical protein DFS52_15885 [Myxococcales bacterium]|jgi:hypothetical protein|nr:hypothetical protein [Myxococcales bacterium]